LRQCIGHQKLQFSGLVAARKKSEHVVTFDPDIGAFAIGAQRSGEVGQKFQRGGTYGVTATGETG
jgi:hypothetical protein